MSSQPRQMIVRRSGPRRGERICDGCSNPHMGVLFDRDRNACWFSMRDADRLAYRIHVGDRYPGGVEGFKRDTGCRMDCRPFAHAEKGHADDVTVHDSWMSTADDGSGTPQLNVKMEHTQIDDRGRPIETERAEEGCPYFHAHVQPTEQGLVIPVGGFGR